MRDIRRVQAVVDAAEIEHVHQRLVAGPDVVAHQPLGGPPVARLDHLQDALMLAVGLRQPAGAAHGEVDEARIKELVHQHLVLLHQLGVAGAPYDQVVVLVDELDILVEVIVRDRLLGEAHILAQQMQFGDFAAIGEQAGGGAFQEAGRPQPLYDTVAVLNSWLRLAMETGVKFTAWPQPASLEGNTASRPE